MDKFELLCLLEAISNYAYDIHYTAKGRYFFSDHLFSERLSDVDVKDDFIETFYLGKSEEAPSSADIARKVATLTPQITDNTQDNFKRLRDLIIRALMTIQKYDGTKGEEDILGAIAHILQRHNGLLYRQLIYTPEEIRNDNSDWREIVGEEDTTQTLENEKWITVHPNGQGTKGRPLKIEDGETVDEAIARQFKQKNLFGKDVDLGTSPDFEEVKQKSKLQEQIKKGLHDEVDDDYEKAAAAEQKYIELFGQEAFDNLVESIYEEDDEAKAEKERKNKYRDWLRENLSKEVSKVVNRAEKSEPKITKAIEAEAKKQGVKNIGLPYRKKDLIRAMEKAKSDVKKGDRKNIEDAFDKMYDLIRYTQSGNVKNLVDAGLKTLKNLQEQGHQVKVIKNFFLDDNSDYKGVNVQMVAPNGAKYELQFHTPKNAAIKEKMHKIYEKKRAEGVSEEQKAKYDKQMKKLRPYFEVPENIEKFTMESL